LALDRTAAEEVIRRAPFRWHQRFEVAPGVFTPGDNDVPWLLAVAQLPEDLTGLSVLDVGTSNGGVCWAAEARGAARVVGVDIPAADHSGFAQIRELLGSSAEYVQSSIYDLPELLGGEQFDYVVFWGVLYHLRHPLLALDNLRRLTRGAALIETAVCDHELPSRLARRPYVRFYRGGELEANVSNWFAPTIAALLDWCDSSGFRSSVLGAWPPPARRLRGTAAARRLGAGRELPRLARPGDTSARRVMVHAEPAPGEPEYRQVSWAEGPLSVRSV
jgi:tRNA (mo5U34)-methyltransferase